MQALKTRKEAQRHADWIKRLTGETHLILRVNPGTMAWDCGYRFGTCSVAEVDVYLANGAQFVCNCGEDMHPVAICDEAGDQIASGLDCESDTCRNQLNLDELGAAAKQLRCRDEEEQTRPSASQ